MGTRNLNSSNNNRHGACNVLPCKMVCVEWKPLGEFRHSLELVKTIVEALDCTFIFTPLSAKVRIHTLT